MVRTAVPHQAAVFVSDIAVLIFSTPSSIQFKWILTYSINYNLRINKKSPGSYVPGISSKYTDQAVSVRNGVAVYLQYSLNLMDYSQM